MYTLSNLTINLWDHSQSKDQLLPRSPNTPLHTNVQVKDEDFVVIVFNNKSLVLPKDDLNELKQSCFRHFIEPVEIENYSLKEQDG